jgi:pyridoxine 5-phosphate synthase
LGLEVNAGHGLDYLNTKEVAAIRGVNELNIGHSIISRAIFVGLPQAVREMLEIIR